MKKTIKAWAILNKKKQVIAGVGDRYDYDQAAIYFTKPPKWAVYPDEVSVPIEIIFTSPS